MISVTFKVVLIKLNKLLIYDNLCLNNRVKLFYTISTQTFKTYNPLKNTIFILNF